MVVALGHSGDEIAHVACISETVNAGVLGNASASDVGEEICDRKREAPSPSGVKQLQYGGCKSITKSSNMMRATSQPAWELNKYDKTFKWLMCKHKSHLGSV